MARITQFTIERFRQFDKAASIDFKPITLLIGANNSGKTAVLQALTLFQYCLETCIARNGNGKRADEKLHLKSANIGPDDFGRLPVATPTDLWPQGKAKGAIRLTAIFDMGGELTFEIELKYNLFNIKPVVQHIQNQDALLKSFGIRLIPIFSGLLPKEEFLTVPSRLERQRSQRYGEIVRNLLFTLKRDAPKRFKLFRDLIQRLYPDAEVDVNYDEEIGRRVASAKIDSTYNDSLLKIGRDLIVAGSGMHQAIQIFSGVLQPGATTILLDEPDAHLHARLQGALMRILSELADEEGLQFIIATHSPQLLRTAPEGSLLICRAGAVAPFTPNPDQLEILDNLGALDRMELVPLLQSRRVVFVENREDRHIVELFARKYFDAKAEPILRGVTFLYTYQEPVSSRVLEKARQVRDLLNDPSLEALGAGQSIEFLSIGDRDYRTEAELRAEERSQAKKSKQQGFGFPFKLLLWRRTEIENYMLDLDAMASAVRNEAAKLSRKEEWIAIESDFIQAVRKNIEDQKPSVQERFAARIQDRDRRKNLQTAMDEARQVLDPGWSEGTSWCDAKTVLSFARKWVQDHGFPAQALSIKNIIEAMPSVPDDIQVMLKTIRKLSKAEPRKRPPAPAEPAEESDPA